VFWNEPPTLSFTSCLITQNKERILTGTQGGLCVLWVLQRKGSKKGKRRLSDVHALPFNASTSMMKNGENNDSDMIDDHDDESNTSIEQQSTLSDTSLENQQQKEESGYCAEPFAVLYGHESKVTDMAECVYDYTPSVCSVSVDGSLCVWNLSDGRCMALSPYILSDTPTSIVSLPGGNQVACAGKHNNIEIVDLKQLKIVRRIEGHTEWVRSLSCGIFREASENFDRTVMLSVGEDCTLRYWMFEQQRDRYSHDPNNLELGTQMPCYTVDTQSANPLCVAHSPDWAYVVVVFEDRWMVFAYQGYRPLFVVPALPFETLKGGLFIDTDHVLIYAQSGEGYVYKLPVDGSLRKSMVITKRANVNVTMQKTVQPMTATTKLSNRGSESDDDHSDDDMHDDQFVYIKNEYQHATGRPEDNSMRANRQSLSKDTHQSGNLINTLGSVLSNFGMKKKPSFDSLFNLGRTEKEKEKGSTHKHNVSFHSSSQVGSSSSSKHAKSASVSVNSSEPAIIVQKPSPATPIDNKSLQYSTETSSSPQISPRTPTHLDTEYEYDVQGATDNSTSIGAAIERATKSSIFDSNQHASPISRPIQQPILIKHLQEEENVKASLGTSVWRSQGNFVLRADTNGNLKIWTIDICSSKTAQVSRSQSMENIATEVKDDQEVVIIDEVTTSSLEAGWPKSEKQLNNNRITASQFAIDRDRTPKLIHGYLDGKIGIFPTSVSAEQPITFQAHSMKVTSLLVVDDEDNDRRLLVSGSADYSVKIWALATGDLLQEFFYHSGALNLIFLPPKTIRKKMQNCFCSVAEDRSVVIYSIRTMEVIHVLGGHSSSVLAVYWRVDLDYLLVRCSDGSVYIWQLSTGLLERRVFGKVAAELIERSEGPGSSRRPTVKISFSKQSAYTEVSKGFLESVPLSVTDTEPDVQLLMLSVRRLIGYVNSKRDLIREVLQKREQQEANPSEEKYLPYSLICALAYVFQYGVHKSLSELRQLLKIESPEPAAYIGLKGVGSTFSLIVPKASNRSHPFIFSPVLSALHTISCVSILNCLSSIPQLKDICSQCIKYYLNDMHNDFEQYEDPSFLWCAHFLKDTAKEVQNAARAVMGSVLQRMELTQLKNLAEKLSSTLLESQTDSSGAASTNSKQNIVVALAILAYKQPKAVDGRIASITAMGLIEILERGGSQHSTAISLLGDGYSIWQYYIPDAAAFCRQLFQLALPALIKSNKSMINSPENTIASDALQAFINMASVDTREFISFISGVVANAQQTSTTTLSAAITSLYPLIHHYPDCLVDHLVTVTGLLLKVLDPHFPTIRDVCMPASTNILRYMVEVYPMVSFHQERQKLAVGNTDGYIVIYDMRTASKWQLFEAHKVPVAAVSFSPTGEYLCTYSPRDYTCKLWNTDGSGVLNLLGVGSRAIKSFEVPGNKSSMKTPEILQYVKFEWNGPKSFSLKPGKNLNKQTFSV